MFDTFCAIFPRVYFVCKHKIKDNKDKIVYVLLALIFHILFPHIQAALD